MPVRDNRLDAVRTVLRDLEIRELPFPADTAVRLASVLASTGLRMPDCCVVVAAEDAGAAVATFDERLARVAQECGLSVPQR